MSIPAKLGKRKPRKRRVPQLRFTRARGIGWHVSYRDPRAGTPRKHRFGMVTEEEARVAYHRWLADHLSDTPPARSPGRPVAKPAAAAPASTPHVTSAAGPGSLANIASSLLDSMESRVRQEGQPRARGTIDHRVFIDRRKHVRDFLAYLNEVHGPGTVGSLTIADLTMADVEGYNQAIVKKGYSASQVGKRMQMVKALVDRAGRPEHGQQMLAWNWDSRDTAHGAATDQRTLPTLPQLKKILAACDLREATMVWMAIGLGFGQRDLSVVRVGQIDRKSYDLRRGKTGVERYGTTPPLVWAHIEAYTREHERGDGELMFVTRTGRALVHGRSDAVHQWWRKLRESIGESKETLEGFYVLRHLGATEFGSRRGASISGMKRWLGHSAGSRMADVYMRPVAPEHRDVVAFVRARLQKRDM